MLNWGEGNNFAKKICDPANVEIQVTLFEHLTQHHGW